MLTPWPQTSSISDNIDKSISMFIVVTALTTLHPESVVLESSVKPRLGQGLVWQKIPEPLTSGYSRLVCTHFNQDDHLYTTMNISDRLVDLERKLILGVLINMLLLTQFPVQLLSIQGIRNLNWASPCVVMGPQQGNTSVLYTLLSAHLHQVHVNCPTKIAGWGGSCWLNWSYQPQLGSACTVQVLTITGLGFSLPSKTIATRGGRR